MDLLSVLGRNLNGSLSRSASDVGPLLFIDKMIRRSYCIGSGRECPVCGFSGRRFAPAGPRGRSDAQCPNCEAEERHRLLWLYLLIETDVLDRDGKLLYFAPVEEVARTIETRKRVITVDPAMNAVDARVDMTELPFQDESFDAVVCSHVLEHIPDDEAALAELYRILEEDGDALIIVPKAKSNAETNEDRTISSPRERREEFGADQHVRLYGRDFVDLLTDAGFTVSVETYAKEFSDDTIDRYGLTVNEQFLEREFEDIHHCRKLHR